MTMIVIENKDEFKSLIREAMREELNGTDRELTEIKAGLKQLAQSEKEEMVDIEAACMLIGINRTTFNRHYRKHLKNVSMSRRERYLKSDVLTLHERIKKEK